MIGVIVMFRLANKVYHVHRRIKRCNIMVSLGVTKIDINISKTHLLSSFLLTIQSRSLLLLSINVKIVKRFPVPHFATKKFSFPVYKSKKRRLGQIK